MPSPLTQCLDPATHEVVLALCVGFSIPGLMPPLLHSGDETPEQLLARARAAGSIQADGRPSPQCRDSLLQDADVHQVRRLQRALVDLYCAEALPLHGLARRLAAEGFVDERLACVLEEEGTALLGTDPGAALDVLELAVASGADVVRTAPRLAEAAMGAGDPSAASRILDTYFAHSASGAGPALPDLDRAVRVSCALWAHRGMMSRAADVQRWAAGLHRTPAEPLGALALLAAGDAAGARSLIGKDAPAPPPSLLGVSHMLLVEGALRSLDREPHRALPLLIRASDTLDAAGRISPVPELPACFAAIVGILTGHPQTALSVIQAALASGQGGQLLRPRLCLLGGWAAMLLDQQVLAKDFIDEAGARNGHTAPREELLVRALEVGLARRAGDTPALIHAWQRAREALLHVSVDLLAVLPLTELVIAAGRLRDVETLKPHLQEAWLVLSKLDDPPLWTVPLHWAAAQAALLLERPDDLAPHAAALVDQARTYALAATFARAGRAWVSVLAGQFDPDAVEVAARGLAAAGSPWEGARLAGHAAARAAERSDMTRLLGCARDLRPAREQPAVPAGGGDRGARAEQGSTTSRSKAPASAPAAPRGRGWTQGGPTLSGREREIAQLVLQGRTYREISQEIFISARTVEHHVARIRHRFGVSSRSELLDRLRLSLEAAADAGPMIGGHAPAGSPNTVGRNP